MLKHRSELMANLCRLWEHRIQPQVFSTLWFPHVHIVLSVTVYS